MECVIHAMTVCIITVDQYTREMEGKRWERYIWEGDRGCKREGGGAREINKK